MYSRVYLEITNVCNKNCSFCHGTKRTPQFMSFDKFRTAVDKLCGITEYLYFHLMGEPLLHPELKEFIDYARSKGFKVAITTNGSLLKSVGERLIESGVYKVSISLHSFENGNDEAFCDYIESCAKFADRASESGVLTVFRLWNKGVDGGKNDIILYMLSQRLAGEWKEGSKGFRIRDKLHLEYGERFLWPDIEKEDISNSVFCYGLKDHFGILCDGSVVPCCLDCEGDITLGNIFYEDIREILEGERAAAMRRGFTQRKPTEALCKKCGYATRFGT